MIAEPLITNKQLAAKVQLSESWVSVIKNTDLFQEEFRQRLRDHRALISARIVTKTERVVDLTLDRMEGILRDPEKEIGLGRLGQIYDITSKRLFPEEPGAGHSTVVNIALADSDAIRKARERADRLRGSPDERRIAGCQPHAKICLFLARERDLSPQARFTPRAEC